MRGLNKKTNRMPIYGYRCKKCGYGIELLHPWGELEAPTEETLKKTKCPGCRERLNRVFNGDVILAGDNIRHNENKRASFAKSCKKASRRDFRDNKLGTLTGSEKDHFLKKHGYNS